VAAFCFASTNTQIYLGHTPRFWRKDVRWMRSQIICPRPPDPARRSDLQFSLQLVCCSKSVLSYLSVLFQFFSHSDHAMWDKTSFLLFYATILVAQKATAAKILGMSISARKFNYLQGLTSKDGRFANTTRPATTHLSTSAILQSKALGTLSKAQITSLVATFDSSSP
jgi:hypothetical protein